MNRPTLDELVTPVIDAPATDPALHAGPPDNGRPHDNGQPTGEGDAGRDSPAARALHDLLASGERPTPEALHAILIENYELRNRLDQSADMLREMREEIETLCAPELHTVVVTALSEHDEDRTVEVATGHSARVRVSIAPDIDLAAIRVGQEGRLTRRRNCLVAVNGNHARWRDIGTFEQRLDGGRALLKHRDSLVAVSLAESLSLDDLQKGDLVGFDPDVTCLAFGKVERPDDEHLFDHDVPKDDFAGLGGLDAAITLLKRAISFSHEHADVAREYRIKSNRGILLHGPPGNGKTRLARCVANYVSQLLPGQPCRFMSVIGSSDYSKWLGDTEERLRARFRAAEEAAKAGPVVMFFDELDALAGVRGGARELGSGPTSRICSTFLGLVEGVQRRENVILLAATNRVDTLDPAMIRPGRLDLKIPVGAPNRAGARAVLNAYLHDGPPLAAASVGELVEPLLARVYAPNGPLSDLARVRTSDNRRFEIAPRDLVSGAILENVVAVACETAGVRKVETGRDGVTLDDLVAALDDEILGKARMLSAGNVKSYVSTIPEEAQPIAVELGDAAR